MGVITEAATIITRDADIVVATTITMDIVTIMENDTELEMVIMDTTTVEAIIENLCTTGEEVITADTNRFFLFPYSGFTCVWTRDRNIQTVDEDFWEHFDWFQARFYKDNPHEAGLFGLNRYYYKVLR